MAVWVLLWLGAGSWGCGAKVSEQDLQAGRAVVQRALAADTFETFLSYFTRERQERMKDTAIWIRWWQEKLEKDRGGWSVATARDFGSGMVEVVVQHKRRETSRQYYRLTNSAGRWVIHQIESER
jgi:hypothetical protein